MAYGLVRTLVYKRGVGIRETVLGCNTVVTSLNSTCLKMSTHEILTEMEGGGLPRLRTSEHNGNHFSTTHL